MKLVEGVSDIWLEKYGEKFLETIDSFCQTKEVNIPMDVHMSAAPKQPMKNIVKVYIIVVIRVKLSYRIFWLGGGEFVGHYHSVMHEYETIQILSMRL